MQSELLLPSWPALHFPSLTPNCKIPYNQENIFFLEEKDVKYPCSYPSPSDLPVISSNSMVSFEFVDFENFDDEIQTSSVVEIENIPSQELEKICEWINEKYTVENSSSSLAMEGDVLSPCFSLESSQNSVQYPLDMALLLPGDETVLDDYLNLLHLLRAYGEAMENGEKELAKIIVKSVKAKSSLTGNTIERIAYYFFQSKEDQGEYLRQESVKNFIAAFKMFYQSLPYGKFAHFAANSAILENVPDDVSVVHVIDFDMGEGIQWPQVIEALSQKHKALRFTSIKVEDEPVSCYWNFEKTKEYLKNYASQYGLKLVFEEKGIADLVDDIMRMKKRGEKEWLVFNCMANLPHMGRRRQRSHVNEFLKVAKECLVNFPGIAVLGDGEAVESLDTNSTSFEKLLRHYQSLFESLERDFPVYLVEARIALESLFLAPFMCPAAWSQEQEEIKNCNHIQGETGLKGQQFSQECLAEARELVNEKENSYKVKTEGAGGNEMVLHWKETPLVRVSTWM